MIKTLLPLGFALSCIAANAIEQMPYAYKDSKKTVPTLPVATKNSEKQASLNKLTNTSEGQTGQYLNAATKVEVNEELNGNAPFKKTWTMDSKDVNYFVAFQRWAKEANYQVRWDAPKHFLVDATTTFTGSFEEALIHVLDNPGVQESVLPLEVCFYPNTPPLARITRKGQQENECQ